MTVPVIAVETPRLILRQLILEDADDLTALYSDMEVMRFFEGTRSREQAVAQIHESRESYAKVGFHFWATILKTDGRFIGRCGLLPLVVEGKPEYEVAYMLAREHWGKGLGTEAARAIKEYAFKNHDFSRVISLIDPLNQASIRVAVKNGMKYVRHVEFGGYIDCLYAVEREE